MPLNPFFSSRKTTAAANTLPVAKLEPVKQKQVGVKQALPTKQRISLSGTETRRNDTSIFSRIVSSFRALSFKAIKKRRENRAETKKVSKEIKKNMPDLKTRVPRELQILRNRMQVKPQEISAAYITDFSSLKKYFTHDEDHTTIPSESITTLAKSLEDQEEKNPNVSVSTYEKHLIGFCGNDKGQASTLSTLLTKEAINTIHQQLKKNSLALRTRLEVGKMDSRVDIRMMKNGTARVTIARRVGSVNIDNVHYIATIRTQFEVPRQTVNTGSLGRGFESQNPIILKNIRCKYVLRPTDLL